MSPSESLLEQASAVLIEATPYSTRAACWIARAGLECAVDQLLDLHGCAAPQATMRSKLTVLVVAHSADPAIPVQADYAWNSLSRACHHHAFELAPTFTEAEHLIKVVRRVAFAALAPSASGPAPRATRAVQSSSLRDAE